MRKATLNNQLRAIRKVDHAEGNHEYNYAPAGSTVDVVSQDAVMSIIKFEDKHYISKNADDFELIEEAA